MSEKCGYGSDAMWLYRNIQLHQNYNYQSTSRAINYKLIIYNDL